MSNTVLQVGAGQSNWILLQAAGGQQEGSLLSSRGSTRTGAWPWSTSSGVVWASPPTSRAVHVPSWMISILPKLNSLLRLPPNWNSYGSAPVSTLAIQRAYQFLLHALPPSTPTPSIVPTPSGCVQLEWHQDDIDIEIEFQPTGIECLVEDRNGAVEFAVRNQIDYLRLRSYLSRLT